MIKNVSSELSPKLSQESSDEVKLREERQREFTICATY
jgi:hypothetical protein